MFNDSQSSSLLISICVSPLVICNSIPVIKARNPNANDGKSISSPTAVKTLPSISPCGGNKKPVIIKMTLTAKQMPKHHWQNAHFCSVGFFEFMSHIMYEYFYTICDLMRLGFTRPNYSGIRHTCCLSIGQRTSPVPYNICHSRRYTPVGMSNILLSYILSF